jgi:hypothetical protein
MADHPVKRLWKDNPLCNEALLKNQMAIFDKFEEKIQESIKQSIKSNKTMDMGLQNFPKSEEK